MTAGTAPPVTQTQEPPLAPFAAPFPVRGIDDVRRLAARPLAETLTVQSTYEIFRNSAAAFGDRTALTFLKTADPDGDTVSWSYRELLAGIHQTANLLHSLGLGPRDAVGILLPGCLEYHLALWGGEAACAVQPLNPLLSEDKLAALLNATGARALIAYGAEADCESWTKALRLRERVPSLRSLLRVAPMDEPASAPALPEGALDFNAARAAMPADRLASGRRIQGSDVAAYFHTGGTTGAPKLAIHTHANRSSPPGPRCAAKRRPRRCGHQRLSAVPRGRRPARLAGRAVGRRRHHHPTTQLLRNREVLRNYWRLVERHRATSLQGVPTILAALAEVPLDGADISSLRYCRTGAAPLPAELAARFERQFGLHVNESLGMTEMAGISSISPPGSAFPVNCVGFPLPMYRCASPRWTPPRPARDLPPGEAGMVLFKAPNVIPGFVDPADTAQAFTEDGWLISGDIGRLDEQGRLHLQGRART